MNLKYCLLVFFVGSMLTSVSAQSARKIKEKAATYFEKAKYREALEAYLKYHRLKPDDLDVKLKVAISSYEANQLTQAKRFLNHIIENDRNPDPLTYLYWGKVAHAEKKFKEAITQYKKYLGEIRQSDESRRMIIDDIRRCAVGMEVKYQTELAIVENLGERVNSKGDDFGPVFSPNYEDKIYFSSARRGTVGGLRDEDGLVDEVYGKYSSDMYSTKVVNGTWIQSYPFNPLINSPRHDVVLDFNSNGSVLYFFKGPSLYSGVAYVDTFKNTEAQNLFPPSFKSEMIFEQGDGTPYFFNDTIVLFSSRRAGGFGGSDLYISIAHQGVWTAAENLGATINSAYDEVSPFLAKDGHSLYFSSNHCRRSIGGLDIFKAKFDEAKQTWSTPVNLGLPINSAADDSGFKLAKDGLRAFYASARKIGYGKRDLYVAYFKRYQEEQKDYATPLVFGGLNQLNPPEVTAESSIYETASPEYEGPSFSEEEMIEVTVAPLYYSNDQDLFNEENLQTLNQLVTLMKTYPRLKVALTSNNDKEGPAKFDLFFSIKRAEKVAGFLTRNGIRAGNILLKGAGWNYPLAKNRIAGGPNAKGIAINRRIDVQLYQLKDNPVRANYVTPEVAKSMIDSAGWNYRAKVEGLSYKVQLASIKQMYNGNLILDYPNPLIESGAASEYYKYTVGLYKKFVLAERLRRELQEKGVEGVFVVPYLNGIRISRIEANFYSEDYRDLKNYLNYTVQE
ncbi:MAG: OmpA family protein [Saprospiraceae bacterium]